MRDLRRVPRKDHSRMVSKDEFPKQTNARRPRASENKNFAARHCDKNEMSWMQ